MNEFQNFDEFHHKKTVINIGTATYEFWHQRVIPEKQIQEIAKNIYQSEISSGKEPYGFYKHDFRNLYN